ncbi:MAG TPA: UDP-N-acetylmuramoyl-L-alanine--D-glutamate ligase [Geopsychrobacteraceae bacterium]|nr:UDP-N-acetylmuramoyl-L-alanine--D-glutamate ligase [Geopsychrobacteraceae bacterium]
MKQTFSDMRVTVIGAGQTGLALVRFLVDRGATVTLSDRRRPEEIIGLDLLDDLLVDLDLGGHSLKCFEEADLIAVSPGVPLDTKPLKHALSKGIPLLGEVEIAARECRAPILAVTGTNGKSTTTSLIGEIFKQWGKRIFVGGNLGTPLVAACTQEDWDYLAVELSSFQLETIERFCPHYGLLLNLSEDHLDRYPDLDSYFAAKKQMFKNMGPDQIAVLNADDQQVISLVADVLCRKVLFSGSAYLNEGMSRIGNELVWRWNEEETRFSLSDLQLKGEHNIENAMAAMIPALLEGCPSELAWSAVCSFRGLEHRMNLVCKLDGVSWYNDSKGTNVGSVLKSVAGLDAPVTLIAGGKDKGGDYSLLRPLLEDRVVHLVLLGEAAPKIEKALSGACHIHQVADLKEAVQIARQVTEANGSVLLSPACSSFDMFENFGRRGDEFCRLVLALKQGDAV